MSNALQADFHSLVRGERRLIGVDIIDTSSVRSLGSPSQTASGNAGSKTLPTPSKLKLGRGFSARSSAESARVKDMEKAVAGMTIRDKDEKVEVVYLVRLALLGASKESIDIARD